METRHSLFFSSTSKNFPKISKVSMVEKPLRISLPVLWPGACSKNFHKTNENSNCINKTFECSIDHLSGWKLVRENYNIKGHIDFQITESGVSNRLSKIHFESFSANSISGNRNSLFQCDRIHSFKKEGRDDFAVPKFFKPIRCHIKANDPTARLSSANSNSSSSSTLTVSIFTASTNSTAGREAKFHCMGSVAK